MDLNWIFFDKQLDQGQKIFSQPRLSYMALKKYDVLISLVLEIIVDILARIVKDSNNLFLDPL